MFCESKFIYLFCESKPQINKKFLSTHTKNEIIKNPIWLTMKSYMLYFVIIIIIVLVEKRQVTGNRLCEKCHEELSMQCHKNNNCWQTEKICIQRRRCPPNASPKHFDTVKTTHIELPALRRQRTYPVKIHYEFPIFKLKKVVTK